MQYYEVFHGSSAGPGTAGLGVSVVVCAAVIGFGSCCALLGVILRCIFKRITHAESCLLLLCGSDNVCLVFECALLARAKSAGGPLQFGHRWFYMVSDCEKEQQQHIRQLHGA
jgi:hypothetical protein